MKKIQLLLTFALSALLVNCEQPSTTLDSDLQAMRQLEDRLALKALVDEFSILADQKDIAAQMDLFTDDATVESFTNGESSSKLSGKAEIGNAFSSFLSLFQTVYHINGQQTVQIDGDKASGISYCLVVLIGEQDGQQVKTTFGVSYEDEYVKTDGKWLIAQRKSHFNWQDISTISGQ